MPYYRPQNEQGMVHISTAYARHKNRLQAFACTSSIGPGATNMVTGAATATVNRIPVLLFPSDYFANRLVDPVLQQVEHPVERDVSANDAFRPVLLFFDRISRPEQLLWSLREAFRVMTDLAETGAVTLACPRTCRPRRTTGRRGSSSRACGASAGPCPSPTSSPGWSGSGGRPRPLIVAGGGVLYSGARQRWTVRDPVRDPGRGEPGRQGRAALGPPDECGPGRRGGRAGGDRRPATRTW